MRLEVEKLKNAYACWRMYDDLWLVSKVKLLTQTHGFEDVDGHLGDFE